MIAGVFRASRQGSAYYTNKCSANASQRELVCIASTKKMYDDESDKGQDDASSQETLMLVQSLLHVLDVSQGKLCGIAGKLCIHFGLLCCFLCCLDGSGQGLKCLAAIACLGLRLLN